MTQSVLEDARDDYPSVVELVQQLVRIPSRGGLDSYQPIVDALTSWMTSAGLAPRILTNGHGPVAVVCDVRGKAPGPHLVLDACLDTATVGDPSAWTRDPFSGEIDAGWLHGRGSADSKAAVAIFSHLAARLAAQDPSFPGTLTVLFDLDEHTGGFAGIKSYLADSGPIDAVIIGYPGPDQLVIGGRGVFRARITVYGQAEHSGSSRPATCNALTKAARLIDKLSARTPTDTDPAFGLPPKSTITSITGGTPGAFSVVPDRCLLEVDLRLTPRFDTTAAEQLLKDITADVDTTMPAPRASTIELVTQPWPPFRLTPNHPLAATLTTGARHAGLNPTPTVAGPSNIGCYLATHAIPATAGFGVTFRGLHGTDEAIELASIPAVQAAHHHAALTLLSTPPTTTEP